MARKLKSFKEVLKEELKDPEFRKYYEKEGKKLAKILDAKAPEQSDVPIGKITIVEDFLPPPESLVLPGELVKETIYLRKSTVKAFKKFAKNNKKRYQAFIRSVLDMYAQKYLG